MGKIKDILNFKGNTVYTIGPDTSVYEAVSEMVKHNTGSLVVIDGDNIAGIITERDYLRDIVLQGRSTETTKVKEIMSTKLVCVDPDRLINEGMAIMTERRIRHLPVIQGGKLVGIVSIGDLVKQQSKDQEAQINYLTDYIAGGYPR